MCELDEHAMPGGVTKTEKDTRVSTVDSESEFAAEGENHGKRMSNGAESGLGLPSMRRRHH